MSKRAKTTLDIGRKIVAREWREPSPRYFIALGADAVNVANEDLTDEKRPLPIVVHTINANCVMVSPASAHEAERNREVAQAIKAREAFRPARGVMWRGIPYRFSVHMYRQADGTWTRNPPEGHSDYCGVMRADQFHANASKEAQERVHAMLSPIVTAWATTTEAKEALRQAEAADANNECHRHEGKAEDLRAQLAELLGKIKQEDKRFRSVGGLPPEPVACAACEASGFAGGPAAQEAWSDAIDAEWNGTLLDMSKPEHPQKMAVIRGMIDAGKRPPYCAACGGSAIDASATEAARSAYYATLTK